MFDLQKVTDDKRNKLQEELWLAAKEGRTTVVRKLVVEGADVNERDDQGRTAMNIASQYGHADTYRTLMAAREMQSMIHAGLPMEQVMGSLREEEERMRYYG